MPVAAVPGLRPTPDRVRETLFNWLGRDIAGAACLDLYAGSGALGFEALSRGAASVTFIDNNPALLRAITDCAARLAAQDYRVVCTDAGAWLRDTDEQFDLMFLDPPFHQGLIPRLCRVLVEKKCLKPRGLVYIECEPGTDIPACLQMKKQKTAGEVQYGLYEIAEDTP